MRSLQSSLHHHDTSQIIISNIIITNLLHSYYSKTTTTIVMSKSPSLRRIQADIRELQMDPSDQYHAAPLDNDMFVWHFTIRGATETDFENGTYHGKILLPAEYPFKPPNIMFTTPNGRFETNTKLCLSFSAYHPELWQPAWGIRLILEALISFLPTKGDGAIGALEYSSEERKKLACQSKDYCCPTCGNAKFILDKWSERVRSCNGNNVNASSNSNINGNEKNDNGSGKRSRFQKEIEQLHVLQAAAEGPKENEKKKDEDANVKQGTSTCTAEEISGPVKREEVDVSLHEIEKEIDIRKEHDQNSPMTENVDETNILQNNINADSQSGHSDDVMETSEQRAATAKETVSTVSTASTVVMESSLFTEVPDQVVHAGIVILSVIVFVLIRILNEILYDDEE